MIKTTATTCEEKSITGKNGFTSISATDQFVNEVIGAETFKKMIPKTFHNKVDLELCPSDASGYLSKVFLNDVADLNEFLITCNDNLATGQYFIFYFQPKSLRLKLLYEKYPKPVAYPIFLWNFIIHRVFPKLVLTQKVYFIATKKKYPSISISESLARIICAGFYIEAYKIINNRIVIIAKKDGEPAFPDSVSQGLLIKLARIGKNGKLTTFYKLRTMHPYSEFLQEYLFEKFGTKDGDKIESDFRVTRWGKFFRKYWLDEIPMLINLLKLELKLVGVRPLSKHKFYTYPEELQKERIKVKPGLIPPYYADLPETPEDFFDSERRYLEAYREQPFITDLKYFFRSMKNIVFRGVRSR